MVIEKAKRLVEHKRVVILLDSITRLVLQHCGAQPGKVLTGGVDAMHWSAPSILWCSAKY